MEKYLKGVMLDVSRGQVPRIKTFKKIIKILSNFKIDFISLYIEHTFKYKNHPIIWRNTGALSQKEIRDIINYASKYNISVIPSIQTMGHFEKVLRHKEYAKLSESELYYSLSPVFKETYNFLEDIISDISKTFDSEYINIGCDEVWDLGSNKSLPLLKKLGGKEKLFINHILKVKKICEKYNKKVMMWGDMLLNEKILRQIPEDIIILNWRYEKEKVNEFKKRIKKLGKYGHIQIICPGVSNWSTLFPDVRKAEENIKNFIIASKIYNKNIDGFMVTSWGDDNNFNFIGEALIGIIYFAQFLQNFKIDDRIYNLNYKNIWQFKKNPKQSLNKIFLFFGDFYKYFNLKNCHELFYKFWEKGFLSITMPDKFNFIYKKVNIYINLLKKTKPKKYKIFFNEILYKMEILRAVLKRIESEKHIIKLYSEAYSKMWEIKKVNENLETILKILRVLIKLFKKFRLLYIFFWHLSYRGEGLKYNIERFSNIISFYRDLFSKFKKIKRNYNKKGGGLVNPRIIFNLNEQEVKII